MHADTLIEMLPLFNQSISMIKLYKKFIFKSRKQKIKISVRTVVSRREELTNAGRIPYPSFGWKMY